MGLRSWLFKDVDRQIRKDKRMEATRHKEAEFISARVEEERRSARSPALPDERPK